MRDDNTSTGGQWDNPMGQGNQGKWEHREGETSAVGGAPTAARAITLPVLNSRPSPGLLLIMLVPDTTGGVGGNTYTPQNLGQSGYEQGSNTSQAATGPGGMDVQSDRYPSMATGQTAGFVDPRLAGGRQTEDDDEYRAAVGAGGGGNTGKPSMTSRVMGTSSPSVVWSRALAQN
jgi:hypothetical protein